MGLVPTLTQLGYALGILLLAPLGDRHDRRSLITLKAAGLALALLACGLAPGVGMLLAASLVVGVMATMAQDIVPAAASLAPEAHRGRIVGTVMTGLLLGILLSRVASGLVAQQFGWRAVYGLAAVGVAAIGVASWRGLPHLAPTTTLGYGALMRSLTQLWQRHRRCAARPGPRACCRWASAPSGPRWRSCCSSATRWAAPRPAPSAWPARPAPWPRRWPAAWPTAAAPAG
jgi:MFS family permease